MVNEVQQLLDTGCPAKADLIFLLDTSGSVGRINFYKMQQFVLSVIDEMNVGRNDTRIGLATFSTNAHMSFNLEKHATKQEIRMAVLDTPYRYGDTNTADGLRMVRDMFRRSRGNREDVRNLAVLVTG